MTPMFFLFAMMGLGCVALLSDGAADPDYDGTDATDGDETTDTTDGTGTGTVDPTPDTTGGESLTGGVTDSGNTDDGILTVAAGGSLFGTTGDDTIEMGTAVGDPILVRALAGHDRIELYDSTAESDADLLDWQQLDSTIDGGEGNDRILAVAANSTILGGQGNDVIKGYYDNSRVDGGDGNDRIGIESLGPSDTTVLGGFGNDIIDAHIDGGLVEGGPGDDQLHAYSGGTLTTSVTGGAGIDFFSIHAEDLPVSTGQVGFNVTGGAGIDVFQVSVNEGAQDSSFWTGENVSVTPEGALRVNTGTITDFTPGEDLLVIDGAPLGDGVSLSTITFQEIASADGVSTDVTLTYASTTPGILTREIVFTLDGASGLSETDIQLLDTTPGSMEIMPIGAAAAA